MDRLNLMKSYVAVVEEGSFTAAAKRLGKTKALLSTQVSQLEENLKVRLLQRSTRNLTVTDAGQVYWQEAKRIIDDVETLESQLQEDNCALTGHIRISAPVTFAEETLPNFIADFMQRHPNLTVEMILTDRYTDIVSEGFDLAIRVGHLKDANLIARPLAISELILCASPEFLAQQAPVTHPEQLATLPCIIDNNYPNQHHWQYRPRVQSSPEAPAKVSIAKSNKVSVEHRLTLNNARIAALCALNHGGIVNLPGFVVHQHIQQGRLCRILTDYCFGELPIHALYPSRKHLSLKVSQFIQELRAYFQANNLYQVAK